MILECNVSLWLWWHGKEDESQVRVSHYDNLLWQQQRVGNISKIKTTTIKTQIKIKIKHHICNHSCNR